jgi:predicted DNA-binding transcriptional regulator YafY
MRASRLLSIMLLLQARGRVTAAALAEEFEVSVRTIYRDMDDLSAAGVPVFAGRGSAGGFQLLDGFRTQLTGLTADEAGALFLLGLPSAAADLGMSEAMTNARRKIHAALPDARRRGADMVSKRFHLDTAGWFRPVERPDILPALAAAAWDQRRIRVDYESWTGRSAVELDPLGIVLKAGIWYVVATRKGKEPATYRVSAIHHLEVTEQQFDRPAAFDLSAYWAKATREFASRLYQGKARLRVSRRGYALLGKMSFDVVEAAERSRGPIGADGWSEIEIPVERTENAVADLLSLGVDALVLDPPSLVAAMADAATRLGAIYARST